ncbi:MAG: hypothetical protein IJ183_01750 [Prevotella sp.]|nr:hypothetical protein [Prevotella sp.]
MKKKYEKPKTRTVTIACGCTLLAGSTEAGLQGSATLGESWTDSGKDTVYLTIPAGQYTGAQTLVYKSGDKEESETLSATKAPFKAGQTYSKTINYGTSVIIEANAANFLTKLSEFNASTDDNLILRLTEDYSSSTGITITRANGTIDLNGHSVTSTLFMQNNVLGKEITIKNGTVNRLDGKDGVSDIYYGTVVLENITVSGNVSTDAHHYIVRNTIINGAFEQPYANSSYPDITEIYSGKFNSLNIQYGSGDAATYILYGGKYKNRPQDSWCADGYSVKANTDADSATYPYIVSAD